MKNIEIKQSKHFFKVKDLDPYIKKLLLNFVLRYIVHQNNVISKNTQSKVYASNAELIGEYRFHIGQLKEFLITLKNNHISDEYINITDLPDTKPFKIDVKLKDGLVLMEHQINCKEFVVGTAPSKEDNHSRLISLPTGTGKTITSLACVVELKERTAVCILPRYIKKWTSDVMDCLGLKEEDIFIIGSSKQLHDLDKVNDCKIVIISLTTLQKFIKKYEKNPIDFVENDFGYCPDELFLKLKVGVVILDEAHQHIHAIYKLLSYTNVNRVIALSATFLNENYVVSNMQKVMFPKSIRYDKVKMKKYIKCYAISYNIDPNSFKRIRVNEYGSKNYSHIAFEKSILKNALLKENYLNLILDLVNIAYVENYKDGDKLIIFASSIKMVNAILETLKNYYSEYDIRRYVEGDPYENVIESDIRVTTVLSSGTAIDIPGLRVAIMTNSISSSISNLQTLGRLRELKDRDVKFYYLFSNQILKQKIYHNKKIELFKDRVTSFKQLQSPITM